MATKRKAAPKTTAKKTKAVAKKTKTAAAKTKAVAKKSAPASKARPLADDKKRSSAPRSLDLSAVPAEAVVQVEKWICLACVLDVFTRLMGLAAKTAHLEIKRYTPPVAELYAHELTRPYFRKEAPKDACPYCGSAAKWHARVAVYRIESGKATDGARRELVKSLPTASDEFVVVEEKATQQHAFFEWLDKIGAGLDLDDPRWLRDVSAHYLGR